MVRDPKISPLQIQNNHKIKNKINLIIHINVYFKFQSALLDSCDKIIIAARYS